jgi:hypothetical protein
MMKRLCVMLLSAVFLFSSGTAIFAQDQNGPKQDLKNAGHSTKEAAKSTGKAVKKGTKKTVHAGAKKTRQGADKVEQKTK